MKMSDHKRGCEGRNYTCTCGYDDTKAVAQPHRQEDWFSQVVCFLVKHDMLDSREEYDIGDVMAALADNYEPSPQKHVGWVYDADHPMSDGGDIRMTAAEEVLAYLLIEVVGEPDDVPYSPNEAQRLIETRLKEGQRLEASYADHLRDRREARSASVPLPEIEGGDKGEPNAMVKAICAAVILGEDENYRPVHLEPREARQALEAANVRWRPIAEADKGIAHIIDAAGLHIGNSLPIWARDEDGRVFEAVWSDNGKKAYWWDLEGESPVDPVEFMPHPLDPRFAAPSASIEGETP